MSISHLKAALAGREGFHKAHIAEENQHYQEFWKFCHWLDGICNSFPAKIVSVEDFHRVTGFHGLDLESASFNRDLGQLLTQKAITLPNSPQRQQFIFHHLLQKTALRNLAEPKDLSGGLFQTIADQYRFEKLLDLIFSHSLVEVHQNSSGDLRWNTARALPQFADLSLDKATERLMCDPAAIEILTHFDTIPYNEERYQIAKTAFEETHQKRAAVNPVSKFFQTKSFQVLDEQLARCLLVLETFSEIPEDDSLTAKLQILLNDAFTSKSKYHAAMALGVLSKVTNLDYNQQLIAALIHYLDDSDPNLQYLAAKALTKIDWLSYKTDQGLIDKILLSMEQPCTTRAELAKNIYLASLFTKFDLEAKSVPQEVLARISNSADDVETILWRNIAQAYGHTVNQNGLVSQDYKLFLPFSFRRLCGMASTHIDRVTHLNQLLADDRKALLVYLTAIAHTVTPAESLLERQLLGAEPFNKDLLAFKLAYDATNDISFEYAITVVSILLTAFEKFKLEPRYAEFVLSLIKNIGDLGVQSLFAMLKNNKIDSVTLDNAFAALDYIALKQSSLLDNFFTVNAGDFKYLESLQKHFNNNPQYPCVYSNLTKYLYFKNLL